MTVGPGVRRRPGGGHRAHRAAGGAARAGRRPGDRHAGARATWAPGRRGASPGVAAGEACNAVTVLGRRGDRGAADLRRRPAAAAPRGVPPLADRVRAGGAGRGHAGRAARARRRSWAGRWTRTSPASRSATRWSGWTPTAWTTRWSSPPCRCGRWAAATPRSARTSWPRPRAGRYAALRVPVPEGARPSRTEPQARRRPSGPGGSAQAERLRQPGRLSVRDAARRSGAHMRR